MASPPPRLAVKLRGDQIPPVVDLFNFGEVKTVLQDIYKLNQNLLVTIDKVGNTLMRNFTLKLATRYRSLFRYSRKSSLDQVQQNALLFIG